MGVEGSHTPPLPPGAGSGCRRATLSAGGGGRGWGAHSIQPPPGRGLGGETVPTENKWASGGIPPPLPEGAAAGSQGARRTVYYVAPMELRRGPTQASNQLENSELLAGRVDTSRSGWPPPLCPGAATGLKGRWAFAKAAASPLLSGSNNHSATP